MNRIESILVKRDGLTEQEAKDLVDEVREMIYDSIDSPEEVEDIMYSELGLEMDYILDLLY